MEYAKDEIFNIKYEKGIQIEKNGTSSVIYEIKRNNFIKLIMGLTIILCVANFVCIYNFFSILSKI